MVSVWCILHNVQCRHAGCNVQCAMCRYACWVEKLELPLSLGHFLSVPPCSTSPPSDQWSSSWPRKTVFPFSLANRDMTNAPQWICTTAIGLEIPYIPYMNHSCTNFHYTFESCGFTADMWVSYSRVWPEKLLIENPPGLLTRLLLADHPNPRPAALEPLLREGSGRLGQAKTNDYVTLPSQT